MTIHEAIKTTDALLRGNSFSEREKIQWLSILDGIIAREIIDTHESGDRHFRDRRHKRQGHKHEYDTFEGYDENTDVDTELLAPEPYSDLYVHYLCARINLYNGEITKYNNYMSLYNNEYLAFSDWYNRRHKPKAPHYIRW